MLRKKTLALILSTFFVANNGIGIARSNMVLEKDLSPASKVKFGVDRLEEKKTTHMVVAERYRIEHLQDKAMNARLQQVAVVKTEANIYQPYLQFSGTRFFHIDTAKAGLAADLFIPLWQEGLNDLVFIDLRINDRSGTPFEGNIHLGYRYLFADGQKSLGIYGAFDRRKTEAGNFFNQIAVGGEYWYKNWFVGANVYQPIGDDTRTLRDEFVGAEYRNNGVYNSIIGKFNVMEEKALPGVDAEMGYEFKEGLVGYVGGYYFGASGTNTVCGPRVRMTYDWSLDNGRRILGVFDKIGLEAGIQHDKPRSTIAYLSANVRVGWLPQKQTVLHGVSRHMVDPVRRDIDVVAVKASYRKNIVGEDEIGRPLFWLKDENVDPGSLEEDVWEQHRQAGEIKADDKTEESFTTRDGNQKICFRRTVVVFREGDAVLYSKELSFTPPEKTEKYYKRGYNHVWAMRKKGLIGTTGSIVVELSRKDRAKSIAVEPGDSGNIPGSLRLQQSSPPAHMKEDILLEPSIVVVPRDSGNTPAHMHRQGTDLLGLDSVYGYGSVPGDKQPGSLVHREYKREDADLAQKIAVLQSFTWGLRKKMGVPARRPRDR